MLLATHRELRVHAAAAERRDGGDREHDVLEVDLSRVAVVVDADDVAGRRARDGLVAMVDFPIQLTLTHMPQ